MNALQEIKPHFYELNTAEYAKLTGQSASTVRRRCEMGELDCFRTGEDGKNGHWRIKVRPEHAANKDRMEALERENAELRARIEAIRRVVD